MQLNYLKINLILICLIQILTTNVSFAQNENNAEYIRKEESFIKSIRQEFVFAFTPPYRIAKNKTLQFLLFSSVLGLTFSFDEAIDDEIGIKTKNESKLKWPIEVGEGYDRVGPQYFIAGLTGAVFTGGLLLKNNRLLDTSKLMFKSTLFIYLIAGITKISFGRSRPNSDEGPRSFHTFNLHNDDSQRSMFSAHTAFVSSIMTIIAKQYNNKLLNLAAYISAFSVGIQRVDSRKHWASDALVGGGIGYLIGNSVMINNDRKKSDHVTLIPRIGINHVGISVRF